MRSLRIVIVDDEPPAVRRLQLALVDAPGVEVVGTADNGEAGLELIRALHPDVVLLDIKMPLLDGLELAQALGDDYAPALIFVTAFREFAVEAFELAAVDFLTKPVRFPRLQAAVERARVRLDQSTAHQRASELQELLRSLREEEAAPRRDANRTLWVSEGRGRTPVPLGAVEWLEAERDFVRVHTARRSYLMRGTLQKLADDLAAAGFWRVHRSAVINLAAVTGLRPRTWGLTAVRLAGGAEVPVGRSYIAELKARLGLTADQA